MVVKRFGRLGNPKAQADDCVSKPSKFGQAFFTPTSEECQWFGPYSNQYRESRNTNVKMPSGLLSMQMMISSRRNSWT
jgi:hypothetical protein